jgi:membrane-bound lytic murein transglycosylase B
MPRMTRILDGADVALPAMPLSRRSALTAAFGSIAALALGSEALAKPSRAFELWVESFRPYALKRGVSAGTYARVMNAISPDMSVF